MTSTAEDLTLADFHGGDSPDLFEKCHEFRGMIADLEQKGYFQRLYRVVLTSGLDHRITVWNPFRGAEQEMICFDSNSYLGLHRHPRVVAAVRAALDRVGYGTPSAQVLCGTNRYLRELEETVSRYHGREDTMVFPSGYAANLGAITALVRTNDLIVCDRSSHASIHDAARAARSRYCRTYPHGNLDRLEQLLASAEEGVRGRLIATDGVFSMNGQVAELPRLASLARKYGAKLLLDEAHATGILGPEGRGTEDLFGMPGAIDVLVGTFSKAPGTVGGYVCGSKEMIGYLRFHANSGMFTAALPATLCAGITEAYHVMEEEPRHRQQLWRNVNVFVPELRRAGFLVPDSASPITTVFMGSMRLLWSFSRDLFECGVKCGSVAFPAVARNGAILRLAINARHTPEDLARTLEIFRSLGARYGILNRSHEEILEIGGGLE
jgi:glycine C-acetyltransferase